MWSAFWLQKPSILRVCFREEDPGPGGAGERRRRGAHSATPTHTRERQNYTVPIFLKN